MFTDCLAGSSYLSNMVWRYWERRIASGCQFGRQSQGCLWTVDKVIIADISDAAIINEETIAPAAKQKINIRMCNVKKMILIILSIVYVLSKRNRSIWDPNDILAEAVNGLRVDVMYPFIGRLPYYNPDPESQIGGHQVNKSESSEQTKSLDNNCGIDEEEVHLQKCEQSLGFSV